MNEIEILFITRTDGNRGTKKATYLCRSALTISRTNCSIIIVANGKAFGCQGIGFR